MSRKHFTVFAEYLRFLRDKDPDQTWWHEMVEKYASLCAESNPRFDRSKFLKACGA